MQAKRPSLLLLVLALGFSLGAIPAQAQDVGQFTRVVNEVDQFKKGKGPPKLAKVPGAVENQDIVQTKEQAMAVVMFVDDSTITISPKSKVTIEDYMYDADKGKTKGAIKVLEGVVETVIPNTDKLQKKDINIYTTTAIAGIRGTKVITVVKPGGQGTLFFVVPEGKAKPKKSTIKIRMFSPDVMPDAPTVQFVEERMKKKMPLTQIVDEALEKGLDPCAVVKAAIVLGVKPESLVVAFQKVCQGDPEYKQICTPCIILKCTIEAMRALKEVELSEMQYGHIVKHLAPITGEINPQDLNTINMLAATGIQGAIPYSIPTQAQLNEAKLPQVTRQIAAEMINAGAPEADINACMNNMGVSPTETYTPPAAPPPTSGLGGGAGGPTGGPIIINPLPSGTPSQ
jgi:FecR protein